MRSACLHLGLLVVALAARPAFAGDVLLVTDSGTDTVFRCIDLTNDGDYDDLLEVVVFYDDVTGAFALSNNVGIVTLPDGTTYVGDTTEDVILALRDADADGNALDPGEATIFFDGRAGGNADGVLMTSANSFAWDAATGCFWVASANTGTAGTVDEVLRLCDNNADGDANDLNEVVRWWTAPAGGAGDYIPTATAVLAAGKVLYVENGPAGVTAKGVYVLSDDTMDGDAQDALERKEYFIPPALAVAPQLWSIERDAAGWFYAADTANEVIWRFKDLNGDDDTLDPGESSQWYVVGVPSNMWDIAIAPGGTVYVTEAQAPQRLVALRDVNGNGTIEPGEVDVVYDETAGGLVIGTGRGISLEAPPPPGTPFCSGDGTGTACPCNNSGAPGHGCAHSLSAAGAKLDAQGAASISSDSLVLLGSDMPDSTALYFQGTSTLGGGQGVVFGDGLRCAGGTILRLGLAQNAAGTSQYPGPAQPSVSVRGMNGPGDARTYQVWFRNAAAFCTSATFNLSNGLSLTWTP